MVTLKPSEVDLRLTFPPLTNTMGRAETEAAATLLVFACQLAGDTFEPMRPKDMGAALKLAVELKLQPIWELLGNPFWRPDCRGLIEAGFARWIRGEEHAIEFTEAGLQALKRHAEALARCTHISMG